MDKIFRKKYKLAADIGTLWDDNEKYPNFVDKNKEKMQNWQMDQYGLVKGGNLILLASSFDKEAPKDSRHSVMPLMLEQQGTLMPTNMVVDP